MPKLKAADQCRGDGGTANQDVVNGRGNRFAGDAKSAGRVSLRVAVDEQCPLLSYRQTSGEIDSGRRLSDATLLVCYRDDSGHGARESGLGNIGVGPRSGGMFHVARTSKHDRTSLPRFT